MSTLVPAVCFRTSAAVLCVDCWYQSSSIASSVMDSWERHGTPKIVIPLLQPAMNLSPEAEKLTVFTVYTSWGVTYSCVL